MAEVAKWYVIHTYSGYEAMVKDTLEKMVENSNLQDQILEIKIPMEQTIEEKNGKKKVVLRKILPCYVFIKLVYSNNLWFMITNTRGVTGFVGPQGKALPLSEDEVKRMRLETKIDVIDFKIGDKVQIVSGPLESFTGVVMSIVEGQQKVMVNVEMFGRKTDVELSFVQVKKVSVAE